MRQCKTIFNVAVEWGYLPTSPFSRTKQQKAAPKTWHYLKPSEFQRILAVGIDLRWRAFYYLVYTTGARMGELFNLTWSDVDLKRGIVTIHSRPASEQLPPFQVKDHETRTIAVPIQTIDALKAWREVASTEVPFVLLTATRWEWVCAMWALCRKGKPWHVDSKTGQKVWTEWDSRFMVNNVLRSVKAHVRRAKIGLSAAVTIHSLRKSFAQNHANNGTPSATLKDLMGHASIVTTEKHYLQHSDDTAQAAVRRYQELLSDATGIEPAYGGQDTPSTECPEDPGPATSDWK